MAWVAYYIHAFLQMIKYGGGRQCKFFSFPLAFFVTIPLSRVKAMYGVRGLNENNMLCQKYQYVRLAACFLTGHWEEGSWGRRGEVECQTWKPSVEKHRQGFGETHLSTYGRHSWEWCMQGTTKSAIQKCTLYRFARVVLEAHVWMSNKLTTTVPSFHVATLWK